MSKHKKQENNTKEEVVVLEQKTPQEQEVTMDSVAYSMVKIQNVWNVIKIEFNKTNLIAGKVESIYSCNDKIEAEEHIKILIARTLFL